jgi:hypothetical protein
MQSRNLISRFSMVRNISGVTREVTQKEMTLPQNGQDNHNQIRHEAVPQHDKLTDSLAHPRAPY